MLEQLIRWNIEKHSNVTPSIRPAINTTIRYHFLLCFTLLYIALYCFLMRYFSYLVNATIRYLIPREGRRLMFRFVAVVVPPSLVWLPSFFVSICLLLLLIVLSFVGLTRAVIRELFFWANKLGMRAPGLQCKALGGSGGNWRGL